MALDLLLLAAGFGMRLRPLTEQIPKALLPLNGLPLLDYHIARALRGSPSIGRIVINGHHLADRIAAHIHQHPDRERLVFSPEKTILGTGGAIRHAREALTSDPFVVLNSDAVFPAPLAAAIDFHRDRGYLVTLILIRHHLNPNVLVSGTTVAAILSEPTAADAYTYTGCQIVCPALIDLLPPAGFHDIRDTYRRLIERGQLGAFVAPPELPYLDLGTPARYLEAHRLCRGAVAAGHGLPPAEPGGSRGQPAAGYGFIAAQAVVDRSAQIRESVILPGAEIAPRAEVRRSIIGPGVLLSGRSVDRLVTTEGSVTIAQA